MRADAAEQLGFLEHRLHSSSAAKAEGSSFSDVCQSKLSAGAVVLPTGERVQRSVSFPNWVFPPRDELQSLRVDLEGLWSASLTQKWGRGRFYNETSVAVS